MYLIQEQISYIRLNFTLGSDVPEVRGTAEPYGGVYLPNGPPQSPPPPAVRPHNTYRYPTADRPAETDRTVIE